MTPSQPILLIGAARSGTKLLRQLIAAHPDVSAVPYDVNYLWRLGNEAVPHDELAIGHLTPALRQRLRRKLPQAAADRRRPVFVEKTVSNCLRVPFTYAVFPEARFIHLLRSGEDVVESSYRQWLAPPDWSYVVGKALRYPLADAFGYACRYAGGLVSKLLMPQARRQPVWGPRYAGIERDLKERTLLEVCAIQWARCVRQATAGLAELPPEQVLTVRYEHFVRDPRPHLQRIAAFAGLDARPYDAMDLSVVKPNAIGNGARRLADAQRWEIEPYVAPANQLLQELCPLELEFGGLRW